MSKHSDEPSQTENLCIYTPCDGETSHSGLTLEEARTYAKYRLDDLECWYNNNPEEIRDTRVWIMSECHTLHIEILGDSGK